MRKILKPVLGRADTACMMFLRRPAPIHVTTQSAKRLRTSLNSPVVASSELPSGPARAGILVHNEQDGTLAVSVGVRALKTADRAIWTCEANFGEMSALVHAVEAAVAFAEGMGFLFDELETGAGAPSASAWAELMGDAAPQQTSEAPDALDLEVDPEGDELDFDPADLDLDLEGADAEAAGFDLDGGDDLFEDSDPEMPLSKYRGALPREGNRTPDAPASAAERAPAKPAASEGGPAGNVDRRSGSERRAGRALPPLKDASAAAPEGRASLGKVNLVKRPATLDAVRRTWLHRVLSIF